MTFIYLDTKGLSFEFMPEKAWSPKLLVWFKVFLKAFAVKKTL